MKFPKPTAIAIGIVCFVFFLFVVFNLEPVDVDLIFAIVKMRLAFVLILATGLGIVIGLLAAYAWQVTRKPK